MLTGHEFFGVGVCLEFQIFTQTSFQNSIYIGEVFQTEVSDGQAHPLERRRCLQLGCSKENKTFKQPQMYAQLSCSDNGTACCTTF